jgi:hypothetical protein
MRYKVPLAGTKQARMTLDSVVSCALARDGMAAKATRSVNSAAPARPYGDVSGVVIVVGWNR